MGTRGPRFEQGPETVPARASGKRGLEAFDRLPPGSLVGEYEVVEVVAHGGMSTVYRAVHPLIGKEAAVKVMAALLSADQVAVSRFLQEARIVARIRHPNVVDVFSFGTLPDGRCYLVMEWIGGETLAARLSKRRLRPNEIAQTLGQICDALEVCHEQGVVHRDLKPANVFLAPMRNRPDFVKLVDFGIAKLIAQGTVLQTSPDVVLGTPGYASPEQAGGLPVGPQTDVYALGVLAYEMVLGRRPFDGESPAELYRMHLYEPPPPPRRFWSAVPERMDEFLLRMLDKEPTQRPAIAEVRSELVPLCAALPAPPPLAAEVLGTWGAGGTKLLPTPDHHPRVHTPSSRPRPRVGSSEPRPPPSGSSAAVRTPFELRPRSRTWLLWPVSILLAGLAVLAATSWLGGHDRKVASPTQKGEPAPTPAPPVAPPQEVPSTAKVDQLPMARPRQVAPVEGEIVVTVNVKSAQIWFDRRHVAKSVGPARIKTRDAGAHDLWVTAPGFVPVRRQVVCKPGETIPVEIKLQRGRPGRGNRPGRDYLMEPF